MRVSLNLVAIYWLLHFTCCVPEDEFLQMKAELKQLKALEAKYQVLESAMFLLLNNSDLEIRVEALEAGLALANDDITNLQDSQVVQDERFLAVEEDVTSLEDGLYAVEEITEQHEAQLAILDGTTSLLESRVTDLEGADAVIQDDINDLDDSLNRLEADSNTTIGFNARMAGDVAVCIEDILQFQNDLLNAGHRYDPETGKFIADRAGLYHFSMYLMSKENQDVNNATNFYIVKNGAAQCRAYLEFDVPNGEINLNDACAATIEMLPGDEVYVTCGNVNVIASAVDHNGFTGFLVNPYMQ